MDNEIKLVRLQKYLASQGLASRRKCEEFITKGLIKVNGVVVTTLGTKIDPEKDVVESNNVLIKKEKEAYIYIMLNKPVGYITSLKQTDSNSPLVASLIKDDRRVYPVGRLDKDSSGLLLMTNDGELTYQLTHPSFNKEKEYIVRAKNPIMLSSIEKFRNGIKIDGRKTLPASVKRIDEFTISIAITEGRNRQIRKMIQKIGNQVESLHRIRVKNLLLGDLKLGQYRFLTASEKDDLLS